ncbi:EpsG family protein [Levilactobacillus brevis]|uniref:EpsG family protein n=1 Tax=Levilactobacillus brevis TaxID=1580 RepID=UPI000B3ED49E|nr:EpsG family protein [Levilactobacillus brevis]ARW22627.1 hypothetical protein S101174_01810 [Levilactobacillus brevis]
MTYPLFFFITLLLMSISTSLLKYKEKLLSVIILITAVTVLSILNGARNFNIGTDIGVYGNITFQTASVTNSLYSFWKQSIQIYSGTPEPGYILLNYVISRFTTDPHIFYFILGLVTNGVMAYVTWLYRRQASPVIIYMCYILLFYGTSLNLLRQSVALVFELPMIYFLTKNKKGWAILWGGMAVSFHFSAILLIFPVFLYYLLSKTNHPAKAGLRAFLLSTLFVLVLIPFIRYASFNGLFDSKYMNYVNDAVTSELSPINGILVRLLPILYMAYAALVDKNRGRFDPLLILCLVMSSIDTILVPILVQSQAMSRLGLYFGMMRIIGIPMSINRVKSFWGRFFSTLFILVFMVIIWYLQNVIQGNNDIFPFSGIWWSDN